MASVNRLLLILKALGTYPDGVGVIELSRRLELPPSTVHRLLNELAEGSLVTQSQVDQRYSLGPEVLSLAQRYLRQNDLVSSSEAVLTELRHATGDTAFLTNLIGDRAVCVAISESHRPLRFFIEVGQTMPYHAAASARAILAFLPEDEAEQMLRRREPLSRYTSTTPVETEHVMQLLEKVRSQGYAICDQELDEEATAIAAPVFSMSGEVVASISIVAPHARILPDLDNAIVKVKEAAARLSRGSGRSMKAGALSGPQG